MRQLRSPEEVSPLRLLEDVGDDAGEEARAVQDLDLLLLRPARGVGRQHELLHGLNEKFHDKMGLKGSKWSSLNSPGTENPLSHLLLELEKLPFLTISPLG